MDFMAMVSRGVRFDKSRSSKEMDIFQKHRKGGGSTKGSRKGGTSRPSLDFFGNGGETVEEEERQEEDEDEDEDEGDEGDEGDGDDKENEDDEEDEEARKSGRELRKQYKIRVQVATRGGHAGHTHCTERAREPGN